MKAVAKACGKTPKQIRDSFKASGDLGTVVAQGKKAQNTLGNFFGGGGPKQAAKTKAALAFKDVFARFKRISEISGNSSV